MKVFKVSITEIVSLFNEQVCISEKENLSIKYFAYLNNVLIQ